MKFFVDLAMAAGAAVVGSLIGRTLFSGWDRDWSWCGTIMTPQPPAILRAALDHRLGSELEYTRRKSQDSYDIYLRGDWSIEQLPTNREVHWRDVPLLLIAKYQVVAGRTHVRLEYSTGEDLRFNKEAAEFLKTEAEREFDRTFEWAKTRHWDEHRGDGGAPSPPAEDPASSADYQALGLLPGANWQQIQSAYRDASKKFHPDRLSGKELDPDVVELAASRFREINEAYKRLKAALGRG